MKFQYIVFIILMVIFLTSCENNFVDETVIQEEINAEKINRTIETNETYSDQKNASQEKNNTDESQIKTSSKKIDIEYTWVHDPTAIKKMPNGDYYFLSTASGPNNGMMHRIFYKNNNHFNDVGIT